MSPVAAVIVSYNSATVLERCLHACLRYLPVGSAVLVVDNASSDDSVARARDVAGVQVIANHTNLGFAAACNQGAAACCAPLILFLNPDAELLTEIASLLERCSQPGVGAVAGCLVDETGQTQQGFTVRRLPTLGMLAGEVSGLHRLWPGNPWNQRYRCFDLNLTRPQPVEQPAGAFLLLRRSAWQTLNGWDERFYPVWFEDVDLCLRLRQAGYAIWLEPTVMARHVGGHSVLRLQQPERIVAWYGSLLRYSTYHGSAASRRWLALAVLVSAIPRWLWMCWRQRRASRAALGKAYSTVMKLSWRTLRAKPTQAVRSAPLAFTAEHGRNANLHVAE